MTILSSLLPGLRELRANVVAGLLWMTVALVCVRESIASLNRSAVVAELRDAYSSIGSNGTIVIVIMGAYFVGSVGVGFTNWLTRVLMEQAIRRTDKERSFFAGLGIRFHKSPWRHPLAYARFAFVHIEQRFLPVRVNGVARVYDKLQRFLTEYPIEDADPVHSSAARHPANDLHERFPQIEDEEAYNRAVISDAEWFFTSAVFRDIFKGDISTRLLISEETRPLYEEWDRKQAEAELRLGAVPPSLALALLTVWQSPLALFAAAVLSLAVVAFVALVFIQGLDRRASAGDILAVCVGEGLIATPAMDSCLWHYSRNHPEI